MKTMMAVATIAAAGLLVVLPVSAQAQVKTLKATVFKGIRYVALKDLATMYGLTLKAGSAPKSWVIAGEYVRLEFSQDTRQAVVNGTVAWLHAPIAKVKGDWSISDADAQYVVDPLVRPSAYLSARETKLVVIDPGHGGKDPGTLSSAGLQEKALNLDVARRVVNHLAVAGVKAVLTRTSDTFVELSDRPKAATKAKGDLFVSIHMNSAATKSVRGIETFSVAAAGHAPTAGGTPGAKYPAVPNNAFNHSSEILAYQIQKALIGVTRTEDRGVKHARFVVLRESAMPATLVECGFLSHAPEAQKLGTPSYRETIAQGIAQGILNYIALVNRAKQLRPTPVLQTPTRTVVPAVPAPVTATPSKPLPMAARDLGGKSVAAPVPAAPAPAAPAPITPMPVPAPAPVAIPPTQAAPAPQPLSPSAPAPAPVGRDGRPMTPVIGASPGAASVVTIPSATAPARPPVAVAPPPGMLLNPTLSH